MELSEIVARCRLACEAEAEAMGFSVNAGRDIYDGCVKDDIEGWTEDKFVNWVLEMESLYGKRSRTGQQLVALYKRCNELMGQYGQLIQIKN